MDVSEKVMAKADAYLAEGKVNVVLVDVALADVQVLGSSEYLVRWAGGDWYCNCPARVPLCAHVVAANKVVHRVKSDPVLPHDADMDELLGPRIDAPPANSLDAYFESSRTENQHG